MLNRLEYSFYIDGLPPGPLLYCTQEQYSSLMNPPFYSVPEVRSLAIRFCTVYIIMTTNRQRLGTTVNSSLFYDRKRTFILKQIGSFANAMRIPINIIP
jgi:hypothetical protein